MATEPFGCWTRPIERPCAQSAPNRFRFLNEEREIAGWNDPAIPKLWLYNLHYFDHPSPELIARWIRENPVGAENGWEPYPLSLRIVNWIKAELTSGCLDETARSSLAVQAAWLEKSIEHHLLANHLFANAKALVFAGAFFTGGRADRWLDTGIRLLRRELQEQILADGAHFERSPMYHAIITEDVLDLVNLGKTYPGRIAEADTLSFIKAGRRMLGWLEAMTHPDGQISFFNDATHGIAPEPCQLNRYGAYLGVVPERTRLGESGYIRLENETTMVLFDAAPIGPDYQPGHAHADTLSFELSCNGRRVIVNSGTSTYEAGPQRSWERGTAAHSTVRIDGKDQSEMWGAFRVARRARPINVQTDHKTFAEAAHTGYRRLGVTHRRRLELGTDLTVIDSIEGRGDREIELFFHFHPDAAVRIQSSLDLSIEDTYYYPGFNLSAPKKTAVGRYKGSCPQTFRTVCLSGKE